MTRSTTLFAAASTAALLAAFAAPASAQTLFGQSGPDSWTGPYVGVFGGFTQQNGQDDERLRFDRNLDGNYGDTVTLATPAGADAFSPGYCDAAANSTTAAAGCDSDGPGTQGGVRAGYDYQIGSFVVGVVGDYSVGNQEDSVTGFSTTPAAYTFTRTLNNLAAVRARVGYAYGPALIYATGGVARGEVENTFFTTNGANTFTARIDEDEADGYQLGGGVEYALAPHLSVTAEYLYTSLDAGDHVIRVGQGTAPATNPFVLAPNTTGTDIIRSNSKFGLHAFNIGMSYRF
jgi:outer membrane immunogenic protein